MKKLLLWMGFLLSLSTTTLRAQVYSDVLFYATSCPPNTPCTGQVIDPQNVADSSQINYATIQNGLGVGSSVSLEFGFSAPAQAGSLVGVTIQEHFQVLGLGLLSTITIELFSSSGTLVAQKTGLQLEDLGLLGGTDTVPSYVVSFFTPQGTYDIQRVRVTLGGTANVLNQIRVYNAFYLAPATNGSGHICGLEYADSLVASGCSGLLCSTANPELAVDTVDYDDFCLLNIPVGLIGVLGTSYLQLAWDTPSDSGQYVGFIVGQNNMLLNLVLLNNINITLHDSTGAVVYTKAGFNSVDLNLLSGSSSKSIVGFYSPVDFASARIQLNQLVGLLTSLRVYGAVRFDATPDVVNITTSPFTHLCQGDSVVLTATPGYDQYFWSTGETSPSITVSQSGTYSLTALDQDACLYYSTIQPITINSLPVQPVIANSMANPTLLCNGDSVTVSVSSPFPPLWSTGDTTQALTLQAAGTYTVSVTDTNGCISVSDTLTILTDSASVSVTSSDSVTCDGTLITLIADGSHAVTWSTGSAGDTLMVAPATDTTFTAYVVSPLGCTDSASVDVAVNPLPPPLSITALPSDSVLLCNGTSQLLSAIVPPGITPQWSTGLMADSITIFTDGIYYVTAIDSNGCTRASDSVFVEADTAFIDISTVGTDTTACTGGDITELLATANGTVLWNTGDSTATIYVQPGQTTTYSAGVTTAFGCMATDTFTLVVYPSPLPPIIGGLPQGQDSISICNGASTQLSVTTVNPVLWSTGDTTHTITVTQSGLYYVTIIDQNGCPATSDTLQAVVESTQIEFVSGDTNTCAGELVTLVVTANGPITWQDNSQGNTYFDTPVVTTTYTATVSTALSCEQSVDIVVTVTDTPAMADAEPEVATTTQEVPLTGIDVGINDTATGNITWSILNGPFNGLATINGSVVDYTPNADFAGLDSIVYVLCGANACGTQCDTSTVTIRVDKKPDTGGPNVKIPGGLSPNGDGNNDNWVIEGLEDYPNNKVTILNRWGDILYQAQPYDNTWHGNTNKGLVASNAILPDGTYYYVVILNETEKPLRGFIEIRK